MKLSRMKPILALGFALGLGGCSEYKYFDILVSFDNGTLPTTLQSEVTFCKVTVSGADSGDFRIGNCPPPSTSLPPGQVGVFTYSSFADSGTMTFKLEAFTSSKENPDCILGTGTTMVPVGGATTLKGSLIVTKTGKSCSNVTPATGDSGT